MNQETIEFLKAFRESVNKGFEDEPEKIDEFSEIPVNVLIDTLLKSLIRQVEEAIHITEIIDYLLEAE